MSGMLQALLAIILIDLSLSADNALIIGLVARDLPPEHRRRAIIVGGALAVLFRVVLTALAAVLLTIPYLQLVGGLALLVIAYRLARPAAHHGGAARSATSLRGAIWMITVADLTTSLEHVLGIGGAAQGDIVLLLIGLAISIPIVLAGSGFVASIVGRLPWLIWLGVLALVWTGFDLFMDDPAIHRLVPDHWAIDVAFTALAVVLIFAFTRPRVATRRD
jgi:YjbE family integral membrane protein